MSQAHIPQPDSNSPGEQVASTDSVPPLQSIETLAPSNTQEVSFAVGEGNQLDPYFYTQFRRISTFEWNTNQQAGTILWQRPLSPLNMDKSLARMMQFYLAWGGEFIFNFKIAGTGFHAGMLTVVKTPPTIEPSQLTSPQDFSIFPWDGTDAKQLEISSFIGRDIRPIKFHYTRPSENMPPDYAIGGYLAIFVDLPLATSSSGVPRVNVAVWCKCHPSFRVSWFVPYDLETTESEAIAPEPLPFLLDFSLPFPFLLSSSAQEPEIIQVLPEAIKILNYGVFNCYTTYGEPMSKFNNEGRFYLESVGANNWKTDTFGSDATFKPLGVEPAWTYYPDEAVAMSFNAKAPNSAFLTTNAWTAKDDTLTCVVDTKVGDASEGNYSMSALTKPPKPWNYKDNEYTAKTSTESFIVFTSKEKTVSAQHFGLSRLFQSKRLSTWIPPGQCALFQMVEVSSGLTIANVKLYRQGFFTTRLSKDGDSFAYKEFIFKYLQMLPEYDPIPGTPSMANSYRLTSYFHRKFLKKDTSYSSSSRKSPKDSQDGGRNRRHGC